MRYSLDVLRLIYIIIFNANVTFLSVRLIFTMLMTLFPDLYQKIFVQSTTLLLEQLVRKEFWYIGKMIQSPWALISGF